MQLIAVLALTLCLAGQIYAGPKGMMCESGKFDSDYCPEKGTLDSCFAKPKTVAFKTKFLDTPAVTVGLTKLNIDNVDNTRVRLDETVTSTQLTLTFVCMWGTEGARGHCYAASASWMACGLVDVEYWNRDNAQ